MPPMLEGLIKQRSYTNFDALIYRWFNFLYNCSHLQKYCYYIYDYIISYEIVIVKILSQGVQLRNFLTFGGFLILFFQSSGFFWGDAAILDQVIKKLKKSLWNDGKDNETIFETNSCSTQNLKIEIWGSCERKGVKIEFIESIED